MKRMTDANSRDDVHLSNKLPVFPLYLNVHLRPETLLGKLPFKLPPTPNKKYLHLYPPSLPLSYRPGTVTHVNQIGNSTGVNAFMLSSLHGNC